MFYRTEFQQHRRENARFAPNSLLPARARRLTQHLLVATFLPFDETFSLNSFLFPKITGIRLVPPNPAAGAHTHRTTVLL